MDVAVIGATGFIGRAALVALEDAGHRVRGVSAPRLREASHDFAAIRRHGLTESAVGQLSSELRGCDAVVNAAGVADPKSAAWPVVAGANSLLPVVVAAAARAAGVRRMVHVSSMAVQGRSALLDERPRYASFSPYSESKQLGEQVLLGASGALQIVILRPGSVHGAGRATTAALTRFAGSRLSSVAGSGTQPSPQNHVENVGRAVAYLVDAADPPEIVLQPWEGVTAAGLLRGLGSKEPIHVPFRLARAALIPMRAAGSVSPTVQAWARRLELVWFGQRQDAGYLDDTPLLPQHNDATWSSLAKAV